MDADRLSIVYPNVHLADAEVGPFVVLGQPPRGKKPGEIPLHLGPGACIRSHTVMYAGSRIGTHFQSGHGVLVREDCVIGDDCSVGTGSVVEFKVTMGNRVRLHSNVFVPEFSILEDECWLGPNVVVTNAKFPAASRTKETLTGVHIGRGAKIGANATLLPGVRIGAGALIGAGSVVSRDVPDDTVVAGNPARVIRRASELRYSDTGALVYPNVT